MNQVKEEYAPFLTPSVANLPKPSLVLLKTDIRSPESRLQEAEKIASQLSITSPESYFRNFYPNNHF